MTLNEYQQAAQRTASTKTPSDKIENGILGLCGETGEEAPAVDAVPPKAHGEWIWHEDEFSYECSACHCQFDYYHTYGIFDHGYEYATYCPNCGAKMNGEGDAECQN